MELIYVDKDILICVKPAGVRSTDEPGGVPAVGGMLGYQLRGQVVGEIRGLQICSDALVENNVRLYCIHICGTSLTVR